MKTIKTMSITLLLLGIVMFGCRPDSVGPQESSSMDIFGAESDQHAVLDTICKLADTIFFRSNDGSFTVNKCVGPGGVANPCVTNYPWGHMNMYNGYIYSATDTTHWLDVDFTMAPGFVCDFNNWLFTVDNTILVDSTGFPTVGTDWSAEVINPSRSEWKVSIEVPNLPQPCFDMAVRISALRLRVNGSPNENFRTTLWGINQNWNNPNSQYQSNNEFAIHYCPFACLAPCTPMINTECVNVYTGITCPGNTLNTTVLTADATGLSNPAYAWSNGATTASITVSPTSTTNYTVSVTDGEPCPVSVTTFEVNVANVACQVPDHRADFCPPTLDLRYNQTFNIRDYVRMKDATPVDWNQVRFTYTAVGANMPTNPIDWNLAAFNAGQSVTVTSVDALVGRGNLGRGEYRIYMYRLGETTYDDYMAIRVHPTRVSNLTTAMCSNGSCGYIPGITICNVPPGNPSGTTMCVSYADLDEYINDVCGGSTGNPGSYLGACGANPCMGIINRAQSGATNGAVPRFGNNE